MVDGRGAVQGPEQRCGLCPTIAALAAEHLDQLVYLLVARQMLGEDVRWVLLASDLANLHRPGAHLLLQPQSVRIQVADLTQARTL